VSEYLPAPDTARFPALTAGHVLVLPAGTRLGRIHKLGGDHPAAWNSFRTHGPTDARFDHHPDPPAEHPAHGILYAAPAVLDPGGDVQVVLRTCVAEVYRDNLLLDLSTGNPYFSVIALAADVRLLDVADTDWVTDAGGNAAISSGPRAAAREWARAIYDHYTGEDAVHGILYTCSHRPPDRSVALFERARFAMPEYPELSDPLNLVGLRPRMIDVAARLGLRLQL
jgi:hypothetical protein